MSERPCSATRRASAEVSPSAERSAKSNDNSAPSSALVLTPSDSANREVKQAGAHVAADLPGESRDIQPRGLGQVRSFGDAPAAFAGRFHRHINAKKGNPGRHSVCRAEVISRSQIERWIRTPAGS